LRRYSCWLFPAEWSQARAQPPREARQREAERPAFSRSLPHRNIPGRSRKFGCRMGRYWFLNNHPNVVSHPRLGDCRSWCLIAPESGPASSLECQCVAFRPPIVRENGCCRPNSTREPYVLDPTWPCLESNSYWDLRQRNRTECRFEEERVSSSNFGSGTNVSRRARRNPRRCRSCRPGCCGWPKAWRFR